MKCSLCKKEISGKYIKEGRKNYHEKCFVESNKHFCEYCGKELGESWVVYNKKKYHKNCYTDYIQPRCSACGLPIDGKYFEKDGKVYHANCYKSDFFPRCDVCGRTISSEYIVDKWGNKSHVVHSGKKTPVCFSCGRIILGKTSNNGVKYSDGRVYCGICDLTAIRDDSRVQKYKYEILDMLNKKGFKINPDIPIRVVDRQTLKRVANVNRSSSRVQGFTTFEVKKKNNRVVSEKNSIFIINGLPEVEFKGVLAHELLHVYLNDNKVKLKESDMEGFCNLGSYFVYEEAVSKHSDILVEKMISNPDRNYGAGFRRVKKIFDKKGIKGVFEFLDKHSKINFLA